jgi:hypothetical protein
MTRLTLALAAWISLVSAAPATLTPRQDRPPLGNEPPRAQPLKVPAEARQQAAGQAGRPEYVLTAQTEVLLNGKPCRYQEVPASARIVRMEVAEDNKTVLKIYFRTGK